MHSKTLSDVAADQVRRHRKRLRITREELAEQCALLGAPGLTAAAITSIETGRRDKTGKRRRDITVDELMVFGHALAVPPLNLMLPLDADGKLPTLPDPLRPRAAWKWTTGEEPPMVIGDDGYPYADRSLIHDGGPTRLEAWQFAPTRRLDHPGEIQQ